MIFSIFMELCNHHRDLILKHFHRPKKKPHDDAGLKAPGRVPGQQSMIHQCLPWLLF